MENQIRKIARELLQSKKAGVIIGYGETDIAGRVAPIFVTNEKDTDRLVWNSRCWYNLARYLRKPEVKSKGRPAVVMKGCDIRSIVGLVSENQLKREDVTVIGVPCSGMVKSKNGTSSEPLKKCIGCQVQSPAHADVTVGADSPKPIEGRSLDEEVAAMAAMPADKRWEFWKQEFDRCIRCYACRQVCPHCFCNSCIAEKSTPQWISTASTRSANFAWNVMRAFHMAGRCSGCQECARACPTNIRLDILNRKIALDVKEAFNFETGIDLSAKPPLTTYKLDDNQEFIR